MFYFNNSKIHNTIYFIIAFSAPLSVSILLPEQNPINPQLAAEKFGRTLGSAVGGTIGKLIGNQPPKTKTKKLADILKELNSNSKKIESLLLEAQSELKAANPNREKLEKLTQQQNTLTTEHEKLTQKMTLQLSQ